MTEQTYKLTALPPKLKPWVIPAAVGLVFAILILALHPNFSLIARASPVIKIHLTAAVAAFGLGLVLLNVRKGRTFHRVAGWIWVIFMLTVAVSSLFITQINHGHWSFIHLFSALTLVMAPLGVIAARQHKVKSHRLRMMGLYYGGLVIAGAFTFVPDRLMWQVFFGH